MMQPASERNFNIIENFTSACLNLIGQLLSEQGPLLVRQSQSKLEGQAKAAAYISSHSPHSSVLARQSML